MLNVIRKHLYTNASENKKKYSQIMSEWALKPNFRSQSTNNMHTT